MRTPSSWLFIVVLAAPLFHLPAFAGDDPPAPPCFDFKAAIKEPLVPPLEPSAKEPIEKTDPFDFGRRERDSTKKRYDFAQLMAHVAAPIETVYERLTDPRTVRPDTSTKITLKDLPEPHFLKQVEQHIWMRPVFFLTLEWDERWAFTLVKGTKAKPEAILASYEKVAGTSHLRHLCGNILIQKLGPEKTLVYLYEEVDASRREAKQVLNGLRGTLSALRGQKPDSK